MTLATSISTASVARFGFTITSHAVHKSQVFQHIFESVKASLARLQLDYVDVLQCRHLAPPCVQIQMIYDLTILKVTDLTPRPPLKKRYSF